MRANLVRDIAKRARPIRYGHAAVHYAQLIRPEKGFTFSPTTLAEHLGYLYNIDHYFNGNHGIFSLIGLSRPSKPQIYVTDEMLQAFMSLGFYLLSDLQEGEEKPVPEGLLQSPEGYMLYKSIEDTHVKGIFILFLGKVFQTVLPAHRLGAISIGTFLTAKGQRPTADVFSIKGTIIKGSGKNNVSIIDVLKERIKDYVGIKKASKVKKLNSIPFTANYGDTDAFVVENDKILITAGLNDQVIIVNSHSDLLLGRVYHDNVILIGSGFGGIAQYEKDIVNIMKSQEKFVKELKNSIAKSISNRYDVIKGFRNEIEAIVFLGSQKINAKNDFIKSIVETNFLKSLPELLSKYKYWSANRIAINVFEDETAEVESVEFISSDKPYETDIYSNLFKGGTGDFYLTNIVSGWNTISKREQNQTIQVGRKTEAENIKGELPYHESFGVFDNITQNAELPILSAFTPKEDKINAGSLNNVGSFRAGDEKFIRTTSKKEQSSFKSLDNINTVSKQTTPSFTAEEKLIAPSELPYSSGTGVIDNNIIQSTTLTENPSFGTQDKKVTFVSLDYIPSTYPQNLNDTQLSSYLERQAPALRYKDDVFALLEKESLKSLFNSSKLKSPAETLHLEGLRNKDSIESSAEFTRKIPALFNYSQIKKPIYLFSTNSLVQKDSFSSTSPANSIIEHPELIGGVYPEEGEGGGEEQPPYTTSETRFEPLLHSKAVSYIDRWYPYYGSDKDFVEGNASKVPEDELTKKLFDVEPHYGFTWVHNLLKRINISGYTAKPQLTLMQIGYGYTSEPNVTINAAKVRQKDNPLEIPTVFVWDAESDEFFDSPQIDTREYLAPTIIRTKAELRPFVEWIEKIGEQIAFIYGLTYHYHIINSMQFNEQTFMGCAKQALRIIGKLPKLP